MGMMSFRAFCFAVVLASAAPAAAEEPQLPDMGGEVKVPWSDFKDLIEKLLAKPEVEAAVEPPTEFVLTAAHYECEVTASSARVRAELDLEVLKLKGWTSVPVLPEGMAVEDASLDGKSVSLADDGSGDHKLVTDQKGRHRLLLVFYVPTRNEAGPRGFEMKTVPTPVATLRIKVAEPGMEFEVVPSSHTASTTQGGASTGYAVMPPASDIEVSWSRKVEEEKAGEARVEAEVRLLAEAGEGILRETAQVIYNIRRAPVKGFQLVVPDDVTDIEVTGQGVRDFKEQSDGKRKTVSVEMNYEVKGSQVLLVKFNREMQAAAATEVAELEVSGVRREKGFIAVAARTDIELKESAFEAKSATVVDVQEVPVELRAMAESPIILTYKYLKHPVGLKIEAVRHEPEKVLTTSIDRAIADTVLTREGKSATRMVLTIRNNVKQHLRLRLPPDSELWSTILSGKPVKPASDKDGNVLIPLEKSSGSEGTEGGLFNFQVEITYFTEGGGFLSTGHVKRMRLPSFDVVIQNLYWNAYLPEKYRYVKFWGDVEREDQAPAEVEYSKAEGKAAMGWGGEDYSGRKAQAQVFSSNVALGNQAAAGMGDLTAQQGLRGRGFLPIKVDIPLKGSRFSFSRRIMKAGEDTALGFVCVNGKLYRRDRQLGYLAAIVFVFCLLGLIYGYSRESRWVFGKRGNRTVGISLGIVLFNRLFMQIPIPSAIEVFAISGVAFIAYLLVLKKPWRREAK